MTEKPEKARERREKWIQRYGPEACRAPHGFDNNDLHTAIEYGEKHATKATLERVRDAMCRLCRGDEGTMTIGAGATHVDLDFNNWGFCDATPIRAMLADLEA